MNTFGYHPVMLKLLHIIFYLLPAIAMSQSDKFTGEKPDPGLLQIAKHLPEFLKQLEFAAQYGLNKNDYDFSFIRKASANIEVTYHSDSTAVKKRILKAMNHFFDDLINGRSPRLSYNGLAGKKNHSNIPALVNESLSNGTFPHTPARHKIDNAYYDSLISTANVMNDSSLLRPSAFARKLKGAQNALHTFRWMNAVLKQNESTIVVNIPSATLLLFRYDTAVLESKVIVGKRSTRTPRIASTLSDITIYPYWIVPKSIATKELLPEIKKDVSYLERNNFQVLDKKGRIISANAVRWDTLTAANFQYTIRQSTGCDNSLGLIKLNINNPFNVYLHDTPWKVLFESANRFFSHGCVRVQKAKELSHILLKENSIAVDTLDDKASLLGRRPTMLKLPAKVPVLILYNTAWFDMKGYVRFYPDIYSLSE
jgi:murein L,D-transpeptidase YcbB/YkuD